MMNLDKLREALGGEAHNYTDAQLEELRRQIYGMAELLLEIYISKHRRRRRRLSTLTVGDSDRTLKTATDNRHAERTSHDPIQ